MQVFHHISFLLQTKKMGVTRKSHPFLHYINFCSLLDLLEVGVLNIGALLTAVLRTGLLTTLEA